MGSAQLKIKAKKISELDNFIDSHTITDNGENAYVILAYTENGARENYKISLKNFVNEISNSTSIDDETIKQKIISLINSGEVVIPTIKGDTGPQGPQGPQGDGADIDIDDIQNRLNELQQLINKYHKKYDIVYVLEHIYASSGNPTSMSSDESVTLSFYVETGYRMPDSVTVNGAESFSYDLSNKSININGVNKDADNITVILKGIINKVMLSFNLINITYEMISEVPADGYYQLSNIIQIKLNPAITYNLPSSVNVQGASIMSYSKDTGLLVIKCNGTKDMVITASGEQSNYYYFGVCAKGVDDENILEYDTNGNPYNLLDTSKLYSSVNVCPINYNEQYILFNDDRDFYGGKVYCIVPSKYFDKNTLKFKDDNNTSYNVWTGNLLPVAIHSGEVYDITYDSSLYYAIVIGVELQNNYIKFTVAQ